MAAPHRHPRSASWRTPAMALLALVAALLGLVAGPGAGATPRPTVAASAAPDQLRQPAPARPDTVAVTTDRPTVAATPAQRPGEARWRGDVAGHEPATPPPSAPQRSATLPLAATDASGPAARAQAPGRAPPALR